MRTLLFTALLLAIISVQSQTFCDKYSTALMLNNNKTVSAVVNGTVMQLLNASNGLNIYFDGTKPAGSINFAAPANAAQFTNLFDHLVQFFGGALGCSDMTISAYTGNKDLAAVHQKMLLNQKETLKFNELLIGVLRGVGVTNETDLKAVSTVLHSTRFDICNKADTGCSSFCFNYSQGGILSNNQLMTAVVSKSVAAALNSTLKKFFDGTFPAGSTDFTAPANSAQYNKLADHLIKFFGENLGCKDGTILAYDGITDMKIVHAKMNISAGEFDAFNGAVVGVAASLGVSAADQVILKNVLESTRTAIVAGSSTTPTVPTNTNNTTPTTPTTPAPTPGPSTGFGMILVVPLFSLVSILLF